MSSDPPGPPALLIDDGELRLVRALLADIAVEFRQLRGSEAELPIPDPGQLLITTAQRAVALPCERTRKGDGTDPIWMAVVQGDSKSARQLVRNHGFDFLIPETVHPAALRQLLMRALFDGADTQEVERVAFGNEVRFGSALRSHEAIMVDVSPRGCRLLSDKAPRIGAKLSIQIPSGDKPISVDGIVARTNPAELEGGERGQTAIGVRFKPMRREQAKQLKEVLRACKTGPKPLASAPPPLPVGEPEPTAPAAETPLLPRAVFETRIDAHCSGAERQLVGRDLSERGMLIAPDGRLRVGEQLRLFVYGAAREEPMLIDAHVARDDGRRGLAVLFDCLDPGALKRLRRLVRTLPTARRPAGEAPTRASRSPSAG